MSDISDCIIKILADNGVSVEQADIWKDNGSTRNVKSIIELDFSEHDKVFEDKIAEQKNEISMLKALSDNYRDAESKLFEENKELKQRIAELESKEAESCKKEPNTTDSAPNIEWYDNRHQSDCIEINRLNTTIDVLIHKVEYLRQFAGLE